MYLNLAIVFDGTKADKFKIQSMQERLDIELRKENPIEYIQKPKKVYMGKPFQVNQYSLEGLLLKTWVSISEASKQTKTSKSSIIRCCKNKQKTANNFIWKYSKN